MARISKERQAARLRVTKLKLAFLEAIDASESNNTEIVLALTETINTIQNQVLIEETPSGD